MRYAVVGSLVAVVLAVGGSYVFLVSKVATFPPVVHDAHVVLTDSGFVPSIVSVPVGGMVTFSSSRDKPFWPASNTHPSHTIYPEFDPKHSIAAGDTWSYIFTREGDWQFHDHLRSYFTGTVHVVQ